MKFLYILDVNKNKFYCNISLYLIVEIVTPWYNPPLHSRSYLYLR